MPHFYGAFCWFRFGEWQNDSCILHNAVPGYKLSQTKFVDIRNGSTVKVSESNYLNQKSYTI